MVRDATIRADRLVDSLLLLARSDRLQVDGLPLRERVELPEVARRRAVGGARRRSQAQAACRSPRRSRPAAVLGDRGLLERLAGNLVENAVRHNVDGGWLRVDTGTVGGRARLSVESSGPVVAPEEVREPVRAVPPARHGRARPARGAGLGLAIVRAVAQVHGGTADARPRGRPAG